MKLKHTSLAALAAIILAGSASAAATISYSYYTATNSTDTSWVSPTGSISVKAVNFGGEETTFGGVTWLAGAAGPGGTYEEGPYNDAAPIEMFFHAPSVVWAENAPGTFYSGGPTLLTDGAWSENQSGSVDFRIDMGGFTVGQEYLVQFVLADKRGGSVSRTITLDGYSANIVSQDSSAYQFAYDNGRFAVVTARFTPGVGDTDFAFRPLNSGGGLQINGIQVLAIPEPSAALLGGLGLLALLRRRRLF